ncbi:MAG: bifunctional folylpolyglutamate synthase/dihydrofolate synthase [Clostridia bacterium]|nr:bifunctional folylpolyglutamate synthase/dihydrofolate synthase [Clostridia bacterium]
MNYSEALQYLHGTNRAFCKPGTDRVRALCAAVGNPEKTLPVVHVAGTNGKGSFCVILASLLTNAGFKVGRFSSPALVKINECVSVNGREIPDEEFARLVSLLQPPADRLPDRPTEFEILTVLAFLYFREQNCDYVILECGMGGLTDATNVIDRPLLSVITGVSVDHTSFLGATVEEIAEQKAGIIKENCLALWCGDNPEAEAVCRRVATKHNALLYTVPRETVRIQTADLKRTVFDFNGMTDLPLSLLGLYQVQNAANALTALEILGIAPDRKQLADGLYEARWPGRFEILSRDPLILVDGGHNPEGIARAMESVEAYFPREKITFVTGILADKDYQTVARRIAPAAAEIFTVTPPNPRALSAAEYAEVFRGLSVPAIACDSVAEAIARAVKAERPVLSLGSLYLYGEISAAVTALRGRK